MTDTTVTDEKKPQNAPIDDNNDAEDSDDGAPEIAATEGQFVLSPMHCQPNDAAMWKKSNRKYLLQTRNHATQVKRRRRRRRRSQKRRRKSTKGTPRGLGFRKCTRVENTLSVKFKSTKTSR